MKLNDEGVARFFQSYYMTTEFYDDTPTLYIPTVRNLHHVDLAE